MKDDQQKFLLAELQRKTYFNYVHPRPPKEVVAARKLVRRYDEKMARKRDAIRSKRDKLVAQIRAIIYIDRDYKKALRMINSL